eukprot:tig00000403_g291.t1
MELDCGCLTAESCAVPAEPAAAAVSHLSQNLAERCSISCAPCATTSQPSTPQLPEPHTSQRCPDLASTPQPQESYEVRVDFDASESVIHVSSTRPNLLSDFLRILSRDHLRPVALSLSTCKSGICSVAARVAAGPSLADPDALHCVADALEDQLAGPVSRERALLLIDAERSFGFAFSCGRAAAAGGLAVEQAHVSGLGTRNQAVLCVSYRRGGSRADATLPCRQRLTQLLGDTQGSVSVASEVLSRPGATPEPGEVVEAAPPPPQWPGVDVEVSEGGVLRLTCPDTPEAACDAAGLLAAAALPVLEARLAASDGRLALHARLDASRAPALAAPCPDARLWLRRVLSSASPPPLRPLHARPPAPLPPAQLPPLPAGNAATRLEYVAESRNFENFFAAIAAALCRTGLHLLHCRVVASPCSRFEAVCWAVERAGGPVLSDERLASVNEGLLSAIAIAG